MNRPLGPLDLATGSSAITMPPRQPLAMTDQDFARPLTDPRAPPLRAQSHIWAKRLLVLGPCLLITAALAAGFASWLFQGGISGGKIVWLALATLTFLWVAFAFCLSVGGLRALLWRSTTTHSAPAAPSMTVAILMPIYNEDVQSLFANILKMQSELARLAHGHHFSIFILSDSQNPAIIAREHQAFAHARAVGAVAQPLYYRRRTTNTGYKAGNLRQWVRGWGAGYDAMLVLDADSLMRGHSILRLTDALAQNPDIGLIQGALRIFRGRRIFARLQQFSSAAYGAFPANGLALWSGSEGNYFGHNAIIRTQAFAACAGLPKLRKPRGQSATILSHDFVEAALMRRAGWGIRLMPDLEGSFEQAPETLVESIRRDQRWCVGNMQHLRIMLAAGLHPISRFHLLYNALGYLMSPVWLMLILIWIAYDAVGGVGRPSFMDHNFLILAAVFAMLLAPKIMGAVGVLLSSKRRQPFGGTGRFLTFFLSELIVSILIAPILMIHQTKTICRSVLGYHQPWTTPSRFGEQHSLRVLLAFHAVETCVGLALCIAILGGYVSVYLAPIALGLALAPILSYAISIERTEKTDELALVQT